jgi:hypothetical protein
MKHLKPFNENKISELDKAKDFCETYLANLLDDDRYELELLDLAPFEAISLKLWRKISVARDIIKWTDIKDHFIPFLFVLNKEYKVISLHFDRYVSPLGYHDKSSREVQMKIQDVINDDYEVPEKFYQIKIEFFE